jgi:glycosyltransferase involved in cell wall biosynthesis
MNRKTRICLNAMVANESRTIIRMLNSCYKYIDYWVIQDNGSTDGTQDLIKSFFTEKNIPGFLYEIEWNFPGWNRDHTLKTCLSADHQCDWILRMDADEQLQVDEDFDWNILNDTSVQSWNITAQSGGTKYFRTWFWNAKLPWFFQHDKRHETIHLPEIGEAFQRVNLPFSFRHIITNDGQTWYSPMKFLRDALELEIDKVVGNKAFEDSYHLWYIGKSYYDCHNKIDDFPFKKIHADEYARRCIFYFERYLNLHHNWDESKSANKYDEMGYYAVIFIGICHLFIGNIEEVKKHYYIAESFAPNRNEHLMYLAFFLDEYGLYDEMFEVTKKALSPERVNPFPNSSFMIDDRAYYNTSNLFLELNEKAEYNIIAKNQDLK